MLKFERSQYRKKERVANRLDPDKARHVAGPDLGPSCLPNLSADDTSRQRVKAKSYI